MYFVDKYNIFYIEHYYKIEKNAHQRLLKIYIVSKIIRYRLIIIKDILINLVLYKCTLNPGVHDLKHLEKIMPNIEDKSKKKFKQNNYLISL